MVSPDLKDRIISADILEEVMGSDHCPISLVLSG
jgi:Exonuclease III